MVNISLETLRYARPLYRARYQSRSCASSCNQSNCCRGSDRQCIFLHRLQADGLPVRKFGGTFSTVARDFGRLFVQFSTSPPETKVFTHGAFSNFPPLPVRMTYDQ